MNIIYVYVHVCMNTHTHTHTHTHTQLFHMQQELSTSVSYWQYKERQVNFCFFEILSRPSATGNTTTVACVRADYFIIYHMYTSSLVQDIRYVVFFLIIHPMCPSSRGHDICHTCLHRKARKFFLFLMLFIWAPTNTVTRIRVYNVFTAQSKKGSRTAMACVRAHAHSYSLGPDGQGWFAPQVFCYIVFLFRLGRTGIVCTLSMGSCRVGGRGQDVPLCWCWCLCLCLCLSSATPSAAAMLATSSLLLILIFLASPSCSSSPPSFSFSSFSSFSSSSS